MWNMCQSSAGTRQFAFSPANPPSWPGKPSRISMNVVLVSHDGLQRSRFHSSYCCDRLVCSGPCTAQLNSWCAQTVTRLTSVVVHLPVRLRHISSIITASSLAFLNEQCVKRIQKLHPQCCLWLCSRLQKASLFVNVWSENKSKQYYSLIGMCTIKFMLTEIHDTR